LVGATVLAGNLLGATSVRADTYIVYSRNYFYSWHTCDARGHEMLRTQPDWLWFDCFQAPGQSRWSMGAMIDDDFGCRVARDPAATKEFGTSWLLGSISSRCVSAQATALRHAAIGELRYLAR
jgi:hypothetical protein